ncbi:hypothetical protein TSOC_008420 [Tetrabaena socialis]|uniref:Uncharacterized protein n=1 Tax=Tetrabaena socialis TaxID=47790 RepID=A0A2J7ZYK9_9CHLO|nr:hypothetical protein TSOC_008420 [Tetrabaena socialis]|eukprot:PNH05336.1 hypothetical protein TSOC_008420 [Tetrabaena socialis]
MASMLATFGMLSSGLVLSSVLGSALQERVQGGFTIRAPASSSSAVLEVRNPASFERAFVAALAAGP